MREPEPCTTTTVPLHEEDGNRLADSCREKRGQSTLSLQTGGVAIAKSVPDVINCAQARTRCIEQLADLVTRGIPVAVRPTGIRAAESAALLHFCELLGRGLAAAGVAAGSLELTVDAAEVPLDAALFIARHRLGVRVLNITVDAPALDRWQHWLWRTRLDPRRRVAFWPVVRSACPLLPAEAATDVLPVAGLCVPEQSAWLMAEVALDDCIDPNGHVNFDTLEQRVIDVLDAADRDHETRDWPTPVMQEDAWLNRRVALRLAGIGDFVHKLRLPPDKHGTLLEVHALLAALRESLVRHSRRLAHANEGLPAIAAITSAAALPAASTSAPGCVTPTGHAQDPAWQRQWRQAVLSGATRHRNLLAMSPYSVFPSGSADLRYADLLPLMRYADACIAGDPPPVVAWNSRQFAAFHARVRAISNAVCADYVVAEPA